MIITQQASGDSFDSILVWNLQKVFWVSSNPLVCVGERFCQPCATELLALGCQQLVRSGLLLCFKQKKEKNSVNSPWEDGGHGSMVL